MATGTINTNHTDFHAGDEKLLAAYIKHFGYTREEAFSVLAVSGLRRLAAIDRNTSHSWAGTSDKSRAAPDRKAKKSKSKKAVPKKSKAERAAEREDRSGADSRGEA